MQREAGKQRVHTGSYFAVDPSAHKKGLLGRCCNSDVLLLIGSNLASYSLEKPTTSAQGGTNPHAQKFLVHCYTLKTVALCLAVLLYIAGCCDEACFLISSTNTVAFRDALGICYGWRDRSIYLSGDYTHGANYPPLGLGLHKEDSPNYVCTGSGCLAVQAQVVNKYLGQRIERGSLVPSYPSETTWATGNRENWSFRSSLFLQPCSVGLCRVLLLTLLVSFCVVRF